MGQEDNYTTLGNEVPLSDFGDGRDNGPVEVHVIAPPADNHVLFSALVLALGLFFPLLWILGIMYVHVLWFVARGAYISSRSHYSLRDIGSDSLLSWWNSPNSTARLLGRISVALFGCGCLCLCALILLWVLFMILGFTVFAAAASQLPDFPPFPPPPPSWNM